MFVFVLVYITCVLFSFAIILKTKRELIVLILFWYRCLVSVNVMWLFFTVPWVGLQCVIGIPDHTHLLFGATSIVRLCNVLYVLCAQCKLQIVVCDMSIGSLHM